jgi:transposase-like protein
MNGKGVACGRCKSGKLVCKHVVKSRFVVMECDGCGSTFVREINTSGIQSVDQRLIYLIKKILLGLHEGGIWVGE